MCDRQIGTGYSLSSYGFPSQYHSTNAPYSFIYLRRWRTRWRSSLRHCATGGFDSRWCHWNFSLT